MATSVSHSKSMRHLSFSRNIFFFKFALNCFVQKPTFREIFCLIQNFAILDCFCILVLLLDCILDNTAGGRSRATDLPCWDLK